MDYISIAKAEGYALVFTGIGMAYVALENIKLTKTMDKELCELQLEAIGQAIARDWTRQYIEKG